MNILILSWRGPGHPNAGGAEQVTLQHAKSWVEAGHDVWLFTAKYKGCKRKEKVKGVNVIRAGWQFFGVQILAFFWYKIGGFLKKHPKFDLVVDEFHGIPFFTPLYAKTARLAFIHEVAKEVWKLNPWPKPFNLVPAHLGTILEPFLFRLIYKKIQFMTVSESTRNDLVGWGIPKKNITIVHSGIMLKAPSRLLAKERLKTAVYLGAISEDKGVFDAIKVFGEINRKDEDWQFWIIGKGVQDLLEKIDEIAKEYSIESKLKHWSYVGDIKKFSLLARAHVLINPSYREGWGLVNIEANAVKTPVMGYKVSGLKDSVKNGKTGILVDVSDYRSLAENTLKLVNDKDRYKKMQDNAYKWSKKFTWEKATKESLELIESL